VNIFQRLNEVRKSVDYARKEKKVGEGGYLAVTHDQITWLTREHFVKHGIVIVPTLISQKTELTGTQTSRGTPFIRMEGVYRFEFVNVDDPTDRFPVEIAAHAIDQGDKAPGKFLSYAKKYAVLKVLEIESGEEEEDREEQFKPRNTAAQVTKDAFTALPKAQQSIVMDTLTAVVDALNEERDFDAYGLCESIDDVEEKLALWSKLDSKQRSKIKAQSQLKKVA